MNHFFRLLRAFKPLFDASLEELSQNPAIGEAIPISMVIQLIISRSPKDLKSPFQVADWTPRNRLQPTQILQYSRTIIYGSQNSTMSHFGADFEFEAVKLLMKDLIFVKSA